MTKEQIEAELLIHTNKINELNKEFDLINRNDKLNSSKILLDKLTKIFIECGFDLSQIKKSNWPCNFLFEYKNILYNINYYNEKEIRCTIDSIINCNYGTEFLENLSEEYYSSIEDVKEFFITIKKGNFKYLRDVGLDIDKIKNKYEDKIPIRLKQILIDKFGISHYDIPEE